MKHFQYLIHCCVITPQVDSLSERVEELKQDKKRLVEEYEAKLSKVQDWSTHTRAHTACAFHDVCGCINTCTIVALVLRIHRHDLDIIHVLLWIPAEKPWASHDTEFKLEFINNKVDSKTFLRAFLGLSKFCYHFQLKLCVCVCVVRVCPQAQAFYERELEAMKRTQQLTADNLLAWKRTEAELRREFQTQEAALQKTLGKLRAELAKVTDEARENRDKSHKLQASLTAAENNVKVSPRCLPRSAFSKAVKILPPKFMPQRWE